MRSISLTHVKARLSELVSQAEGGQQTIITRHGQPVARHVPFAQPKKVYRSLADFRAAFPTARTPSVQAIRRLRDEGS